MKRTNPSALKMVIQATELLNQARNQTALNLALREIMSEVFGCVDAEGREFAILLWNPKTRELSPMAESPANWEYFGLTDFKTLVANGLEDSSTYHFETLTRAWKAVAFKEHGILAGAVLAPAEGFTKQWEETTAHLCQLWIGASEKLSLQSKSVELQTELNRTVHSLSVLRSVGQALGEVHDLTQLLTRILKVAITTVGAERGFIMLENKATEMLELKVVHGLDSLEAESLINSGVIRTSAIPRGEGIQGKVMQTREPVILADVDRELAELSGMVGKVKSLICIPLCMKDEALGVIYVTNKKDGRIFNSEDLNVLYVLASHAAAVIDQARLHNIASTDELTGLYTRRYYLQRVLDELKRAKRYRRKVSLILVDIDYFKNINDTHGHAAGDLGIREVSQVLSSSVRNDIDFVARYGGEEFAIVLPETEHQSALVVAERIREGVYKRRIESEFWEFQLTVSVGVATFGEHGADYDELFRAADNAMYFSKSHGRNKVTSAQNCIPKPRIQKHELETAAQISLL